jgi:D-alanine-D-alanine ligase
MFVGLTYDLRSEYLALGYTEVETAEFDRDDTIDAIEDALRELGCTTDRVGNIRDLVSRLAAGASWDMVFNIAEGLAGRARESQVPALLEAYGIPYTFSDPVVLGLSLDKALAKRVLRDAGVPTPDFAVLGRARDARGVALPFPLFAKPVAEGTSKGVSSRSRVASRHDLEQMTRLLLARYRQPVLVERFLPGREFTVGVVGTGAHAEALGALEVSVCGVAAGGVYGYEDKESCEDLVTYRLATDALAARACGVAVDAWRALGCRDAGRVDVRADEAGEVAVLEINPLAGLHPTHSDLPILCSQLGISYVDLIGRILRSARARAGLVAPAAVARSLVQA